MGGKSERSGWSEAPNQLRCGGDIRVIAQNERAYTAYNYDDGPG